jgi:hypothetical protein
MGAAPEQRESRSMSHDQLLASAPRNPSAAASRGEARDPVVVPLGPRARSAALRARTSPDSHAARSIVTQIADYIEPRPAPVVAPVAAAPVAVAPSPLAAPRLGAPLGAHVGEIDALLCQHIEVQLDLIARHAPELVEPAVTVLRSLELLLKLRTP